MIKNHKKQQFPTRENYSKPLWAILLVVAILCIGSVSALDFLPVKNYDEDTQTVTISNFLGIGRDVATIQLKTPLDYHVGAGYQLVAIKEIELFDDTYTDAFGKMVFIDKNTNEVIERDFDYKYKTTELIDVNDYKEVCYNTNGTEYCTAELVGTHQEEKEVWKDLDTSVLTKGKITIGIFTNVQVNDYVEWIPTLFGKKIDEWASWTAELNVGLVGYWTLDETSGLTAFDSLLAHNGTNDGVEVNVTGKIGTAYNFTDNSVNITGFSESDDYSVSAWIKLDRDEGLNYFLNFNAGFSNGFYYSSDTLQFYDGSTNVIIARTLVIDEWYLVTLTKSSTNYTIYLNGTTSSSAILNDIDVTTIELGRRGDAIWFLYGIIDEVGFWNRALTSAEVTQLYNEGNGITYTTEFGTSPIVTLNSPIDNANFTTTNDITFGGVVIDDINLINVSLIIDDVYNETNTSGINNTNYTFTKTLAEGDYTWTYEGCDNESKCTNGTERSFTIDRTNPAVIILSPSTNIGSHVLNTNYTFNWSANDTHLSTCVYEYESVNYTVTCSDNTTEFNITNEINRTIIFYVNDTFGHINVTSITWGYSFLETGDSFTADVFETMNYSFALNVTSYQTLTSFSAYLSHNGTTYSADSTCNSGNCEITAMIDIPLVTNGASSEDKTFFWRLSIFNGTGTSNINTSTNTQTVTAVNLAECGITPRAVNFTTHKETDRAALNTDFNAYFKYYLGTGSVIKKGNSSQTGASVYSFCIDQNETFYVDSTIDLSASTYSDRHYDLIKEVYTNTTTIQKLYLLNSTIASNIIIEVKNSGLIPLEGILVNISRFYSGEGMYYPVEMQITDEYGQIVAKLVESDVKYRFNFYGRDKNLLKTSDLISIACRTTICFLPFVIEEEADDFGRFDDLTTYTSTLSFDNTTNVFSFSWDDQRGESTTTRLEVTRYQLNSSSVVCDTSSTSTLSTLTCSVGGQRASYKAQVFRTVDSDSLRIVVLNVKVGDPASIYGVEGLLWVFILLFTCIGIGVFNPSISVALFGGGFLIMGVVGIISMPVPVFFAVILLCVLFIWGMNR